MSGQNVFRVEYIGSPTNVHSEVPEQQELRKPTNAETDENHNDHEPSQNEDGTFVPVFKVTKEEAAFTKGDMKLQKVSVTENISGNEHGSSDEQLITMDSEVKNEVIHSSIIRTSRDDNLNQDKKSKENKPRTRIPKLRDVAEKFKKDKKEEREKEASSTQPRRSSIPKLRRAIRTDKTPNNTISTPSKQKLETELYDSTVKNNEPEKEFDRIFEDIIHTPITDSNDLIEDSIDDAERLEHSFEGIVHDYEENKLPPIDVQQIKSKIPLVKQKSLPEDQFAQKLFRRSSLKDIPVDSKKVSNKSDARKVSKEDIRQKFGRRTKKAKDENFTQPKSADRESVSSPHTKQVTETGKIIKEELFLIDKINESFNGVAPVSQTIPNHYTKDQKDEKKELKRANENPYEITNSSLEEPMNNYSIEKQSIHVTKSESSMKHIKKVPKIKPHLNPPHESNDPISSNQTDEKSVINDNGSDAKTHIPVVKGKVLQLTSKFALKEESLNTPKSRREVLYAKRKSISSKIAAFDSETDVVKQESNTNSFEPHRYNLVNRKPNVKDLMNDTNALQEMSAEIARRKDIDDAYEVHKMPNSQEIDFEIDYISLRDSNTKSETELKREADTHKDSIQKLLRAESMPIKISNSKTTSVTPPNTPYIGEYDSSKDDDFRASDSNLLYINDKTETEPRTIEPDSSSNIQQTSKTPNNQPKSSSASPNTDKATVNKANSTQKPKYYPRTARDVYNVPYERSPSIEFASPKTNALDKNPFLEAFNENLNAKDEAEHFLTNNNLLKGKVSNIINRIDSFDERSIDPSKRDIAKQVPVRKSVSSRIAIFELQTSNNTEPKPKYKSNPDTKPKIIEEVIKAPPARDSNIINKRTEVETIDKNGSADTSHGHQNVETVVQIAEVQDVVVNKVEEVIVSQDAQLSERIKLRDSRENSIENLNEHSLEENNLKLSVHEAGKDLKKELPKSEKELVVPRIEERLKRLKSVNEAGELKKSKSVAELDLGDAVKGKVHQMIVRMNSMEKIELEKKGESINIRERPRKRSVSEKIALFEKKLYPIHVADAAETRTAEVSLHSTMVYDNITSSTTPANVLNEEYYRKRIEELNSAKIDKEKKMKDMMYITLRNEQEMPMIALGTAMLDPILLPHVIEAAIHMGYRAIDTAYIYGNEKQVGDAIRTKIEDGTVKREDLFIIGKLWSTFHRRDLVEQACMASLEALGIDYFDLYLVHNPMSFKEGSGPIPKIANVLQYSDTDYLDAWYGMEDVVKKGLAKSIGVSNFNSEQIARVMDKGKVKPVINQVECHPYLTQQKLDQFCLDRGVKLMCFGALGSKGTPNEYKGNLDSVIDDPLVKVVAAGLNVTPAQLLIRYQLESGHAVVIKSSSAAHLWDNLQALTFHLDMATLDGLNALNKNKRTYVFRGMGDTHRNYPFKIPF